MKILATLILSMLIVRLFSDLINAVCQGDIYLIVALLAAVGCLCAIWI